MQNSLMLVKVSSKYCDFKKNNIDLLKIDGGKLSVINFKLLEEKCAVYNNF